jgi:transposase
MKSTETYTPEYRAEAVKLILEQGLSLSESARRLGMPKGTLCSWVNAAKGKTVYKTGAAPGMRSVTELEAELSQLRRELAETRMERDILKKATAYFAKGSLPGTRT